MLSNVIEDTLLTTTRQFFP